MWLVGLIVTLTVPDSDWENTKWSAIFIELIGFATLVMGNLIYNKIIESPFLNNKFVDLNSIELPLFKNQCI